MGTRLRKWVELGWTIAAPLAALVLLAAHFLHPRADFPNFSPWMDYAKYTDEGWYGNAAVAYFTRGGWYVPGDFNPAVALPVWPFLEWVVFHFTGVGLTAARMLALAVFAGNASLGYLLVRSRAPRWAALLAVVLVVSNAFLYCFSRLAILEPLLTFLLLLCWLLALRLPVAAPRWQRTALPILIGLLLCAMVLTKTTAVFLFPSVLYLIWAAYPDDGRAALRCGAVAAVSGLLPWLVYYLALVRPRYLADYHYLFTANVYPQPTTAVGWLMAFWYAVHGVFWIDRWWALLAAALLLLSTAALRELWRDQLFTASALAIAGYLFFIGFHNNMQPRYYQVVAFPLAILVALGVEAIFRQRGRVWMGAAALSTLGLAWSIAINARETLWFTSHPQYTFVDAARNLTRYIDQHPNRNRLLLSISGSNIALITGLPAICDDFGTLALPERIRRYQPGWYAAWNELDPGTLEDLSTQFRLEQVANFPAYDDEDRDNLILYKLIPLETESPPSQRPRRPRRRAMGAIGGKPAVRRVAD